MDHARLVELAQVLGDAAQLDAPLASYSRAGIGGPADLLVVARDTATLASAVRLAREADVPWRIFGGLTNILLPDSGLRGVVIINQATAAHFDAATHRVRADSGAVMIKLAREAVRRGWGGLTWAVGLPGTLGGAVVNNAGAFGGEISGTLVAAEVLGPESETHEVDASWFDFRYRCSKLKGAGDAWVVLAATLQLRPGTPSHLAAKAAEYTERRQRTQPPGRTLGSTFKNPPDDYAGRLIEAAGLKGHQIGGIKVSEQHANFLINTNPEGGAASNYRALLRVVQTQVQQQFDVWLEPEIEMLPEESRRF
jgi:UDP-N-acetylmuramate dehydrogenase